MAESSHNPYPRSPNPSTRSYDSSSVSSATSPRPPSRYLGGMLASASRSNPASQQPSLGIPTLPPVNEGFPPYTPGPPTSMMGRESVTSTDSLVGGSQAGHASGQGQKRAYRQRRKDPSCDACRERKVKCDATETTSCSECSSRNVKCQFTKETNRRMSSIKQVQDLEKQIERVKRDNSNLRRMLQDRDGTTTTTPTTPTTTTMDTGMDTGMESRDAPSFSLPLPPPIESETRQPTAKRRPSAQDLTRARANLHRYAKGIWKPPARHRLPSSSFSMLSASSLLSSSSLSSPHASVWEPQMPDLPPRAVADQLLNAYYATVHTMFPILHLPTFRAMVDDLYRMKPSRVSPPFLSVLLAALALGCLFTPETPTSATFYRPAELLDLTRSVMDPWRDDFTLDDARASVLIAICLNEMNLKSAAWRWLGNAVRVGQDLGLYVESGEGWPLVEGEMRRRTWWATYILDKVLATELGHPYLIRDASCSVALPAAVDDQYLGDDGMRVPSGAEPLTHSLLAVIHVVRSHTAVDDAMGLAVIPAAQLAALDSHLSKCLTTFPPACDPASAVALAPHFLAPLTYLFHLRLLLHRHNLNPACDADARLTAVENCTHIAMETASLISRTASPADGATALLTTHIFRCTVFLLLTGYWDQALVCIRALAAIDARRDAAQACGRYLTFFSSTLAGKWSDHSARLARASVADHSSVLLSLARDEELLAYVSTDLDASPARSWVWADEAKHELAAAPLKPDAARSGRPGAPGSSLFSPEARTGLTEDERRDWGGWGRLDAAVRSLRSSASPGAAASNVNVNPTTPRYAEEATYIEARSKAASTGRDRLSIANII